MDVVVCSIVGVGVGLAGFMLGYHDVLFDDIGEVTGSFVVGSITMPGPGLISPIDVDGVDWPLPVVWCLDVSACSLYPLVDKSDLPVLDGDSRA